MAKRQPSPAQDDYAILVAKHPKLRDEMDAVLSEIEEPFASGYGGPGWRERANMVSSAAEKFEALVGVGDGPQEDEEIVLVGDVAMPRSRLLPDHLCTLGLPALGSAVDRLIRAALTLNPEVVALARDMRLRLRTGVQPYQHGAKKPLSDDARGVAIYLLALPPAEGRTAKELTKKLSIDDKRIRNGVRDELKPHGLLNRPGIGYYFPEKCRGELRRFLGSLPDGHLEDI